LKKSSLFLDAHILREKSKIRQKHQIAIHIPHSPCLINSPVGVETAVEVPEVVDASLHPNQPGVAQLVEELDAVELAEELAVWLAVELTDELDVGLAVESAVELAVCALLFAGVSDVVVTIGSGAALGDVIVVVRVNVVGSLHPNQPGVLHDVVVIVLVIVVVGVGVCDVVVVVSS
jgi:hypothetical protein